MKTPFFTLDKAKLDLAIDSFQSALALYWPNSALAYSLKTNSLPWLLQHLKSKGVLAEVVSDEEYDLALICGFDRKDIVFNGPIKGENYFVNAIIDGSLVNIDSKNELRTIQESEHLKKWNIGLRVNIEPEKFGTDDVGYRESGFRFGFSDFTGELVSAIKTVRSSSAGNRFGLHFHVNSISRSIEVYKTIAQYALYLIDKYSLDPSFIDIGGGFFGGIENKPTADSYLREITKILRERVDPQRTKLIIEPGTAIIGAVMDYHTSVLDIKNTKNSRIITTDGSRIHIDPLWKKSRYMYSISSCNSNNLSRDQIICGYTCMDHDRIMTLSEEVELSENDMIVYHRVGAYTATFGGPFIRYYPEVYLVEGVSSEYKLIRKRMTVEEYYAIQSFLQIE